jgi:hypothetical protein
MDIAAPGLQPLNDDSIQQTQNRRIFHFQLVL